jgi:large subunit ribosomal protein L7/L12
MPKRLAFALLATLPLAACGGEQAGPSSAESEPTAVVLAAPGTSTIELIKAVREVTGLGLADAKGLIDSAPSVIANELPRPEAEAVRAKLEAAGAVVELREP